MGNTGHLRIVTEVPGPRSQEMKERAKGSIARAIGPHGDIFIDSAEGALVTDVDGNVFIDLIGGVGAMAVGHSHPGVVAAVQEQVRHYSHTDFSIVPYEPYVRLAERISERCGGDRKVAFFNTGAEAVENAVKIARNATGRPGIVAFEGAFHGRTYMAMSLTARDVPVKEGFGPFVPGVHRIPYPGLDGATVEDATKGLQGVIASDEIAAVIVEPVLGEGGFVVPPEGFLSELRSITEASDVVLICDEVQTGYGRTGEFFASQHSDITPDLVVLGKSIAAGMPLSAVVGDPLLVDAPAANALGGTYPGNPIACAAGLAVLDIFEEEGLVERAAHLGDLLMKGWNEIAASHGSIQEVRGLGAMVGVEFGDPDSVKSHLKEARGKGVLALSAGRRSEVIRHLMPLVIEDSQVSEALEVFAEILY